MLPFQETNINQDFPKAGISIRARKNYYLVFGISNGGVAKVFDKISDNQVLDDCGVFGVTEKGDKITTQSTSLNNYSRSDENSLEGKSEFYRISDSYPNPINYMMLRLANLTIMRIAFLNELVKKIMVSLFIKNRTFSNITRSRVIDLKPYSIDIMDTIGAPRKIKVKEFAGLSLLLSIWLLHGISHLPNLKFQMFRF